MIPPIPPSPTPSPPAIVEPSSHSYALGDDDPLPPAAPSYSSSPSAPSSSLFQSSSLRVPSPNLLLPPGMATPYDAQDAQPRAGGSPARNPFNFETRTISTSPVRSNLGQRRGHRYKHSSISAQHQVFQEPPQRPPPVLPASLPFPSLREAWASMNRDQRNRLYWCLGHAAVAVYVFFSASGSLAMTALSHLVFFDVGSAAICVAVDVLGNFEVWRRSSVRHPFGLQRAEVLAGFAMSIFLVFGGFDLISHNLKHTLESVGSHDYGHHHDGHHDSQEHHQHPHSHSHSHSHSHAHGRLATATVDLAALLAVAATLVSAYGLKNHGRIRRIMRVQYPSYMTSLPGVLSNPFHLLTLFFSCTMLVLPLLSAAAYAWLDRLICAAIALSMFTLGCRLVMAQGYMLLMSFRGGTVAVVKRQQQQQQPPPPPPPHDRPAAADTRVSAVVREIEAQPNVVRVDEAQFWQVHYGLGMANLKVCVARGCDDVAVSQLRIRAARLIQNRLGEGYGHGAGLRWEVTVQTSTEGKAR